MAPILEIHAAHKRFATTSALAGAGFALRLGECLGLLGPNGAGKTTLVRAISGRVRLDQGSIRLHGQILDTSLAGQAARQKIGIVPQEIALYPFMTATENLCTFGTLSGLSGSALGQKVAWALAWTDLKDRAHEPIKHFSGGMKRRLNIVCSLLHEPEVIIMDEPTVGVDPQSRQHIWEMFDELRSRGASLLLATHQLDEAQQKCERIVIIDHGQTIAEGSFEELLAHTIGAQRRVVCRLQGPVPAKLLHHGWERVGDVTLARRVHDLGRELSTLLAEMARANVQVKDLSIESPTLQEVFLHLTGRELRE
jgi:ABC-2 type transport system ATP-binding protein